MRYIDILEKLINETPIDDITRFGMDDSQKTSFHTNDQRLINNPKMDEKLVKMFAKAPVPINICFFNTMAHDWFEKHSSGLLITAPYELKELKKLGIKINPQAINIILTNNFDRPATKIPMTPWMVGHRLCHALLDASSSLEYEEVKIRRKVQNIITPGVDQSNRSIIGPPRSSIWCQLGTFGAARDGRCTTIGEFITDCMVQYLVKGNVILNVVPPITEEDTRSLEKWLKSAYDTLLYDAVGKIFMY